MSHCRAPSASRSPISRVRSVTETSCIHDADAADGERHPATAASRMARAAHWPRASQRYRRDCGSRNRRPSGLQAMALTKEILTSPSPHRDSVRPAPSHRSSRPRAHWPLRPSTRRRAVLSGTTPNRPGPGQVVWPLRPATRRCGRAHSGFAIPARRIEARRTDAGHSLAEDRDLRAARDFFRLERTA